MQIGETHAITSLVNRISMTTLAAMWESNEVKVAFITNAVPPSSDDSDPRWGTGGAQDYSANEIIPSGNYVAGGIKLEGITSTLTNAIVSLNADSPIVLEANVANPTSAYWAIFYASTDAGKHVFGFMYLGGVIFDIYLNGASGTQPVFRGTTVAA